MMRFLLIGDVMGKTGRRCLSELLPLAREEFQPDVVIANGENAAGGFGITQKVLKQFTESFGIDCVTSGNHWHDKRDIQAVIGKSERFLIPANMFNVDKLDHAYSILSDHKGRKFAVINLIGQVFMHPDNRNPFDFIEPILERIPDSVKIRIVDIHAEATSEKQGLGHFLSGRASMVFGTHSHVPTSDERILSSHTGFITDIGMTGSYDSVIGIRKEAAIERLISGQKKKFEPATQEPWMPFVVVDIDEASGKCERIQRLRWELNSILKK